MTRLVLFLLVLLALALGLSYVADLDGSVAVTALGNRYEIDNLATALVAVLALSLALTVLWNLVRTALRLPTLMSIASRSRRKQKGYQALSRGMIAVGTGDQRLAAKQAAEAERLLGREPMTLLLAAQSAQLSGDHGKAEKAFQSMLDEPSMQVVGLRGLHMEAQRRNDPQAAGFFATEALKLAPAASWAQETALAQACANRDWLGAMNLVEQAASRKLIDKSEARRQRASLLTADAVDRFAHAPATALRSAQEATKLAPSLPPAAVLLGRHASGRGDYGRASKILEASFIALPHPDTAEAYLDVRPGDSALDRLKRARQLLKLSPKSIEARLILAKAALDAREFAAARETLEPLVLERPTARACTLMALLEEAEGQRMGLARSWLSRAARAERDAAWVADGHVSDVWLPITPRGIVGGYVWKTPPQAERTLLIDEIRENRQAVDADVSLAASSVIDVTPPPAEPPVKSSAPASSKAAEPMMAAKSEMIATATATPVGTREHPADFVLPPPPDVPSEAAESKPRKGWRLFG
jgi:HemY protein